MRKLFVIFILLASQSWADSTPLLKHKMQSAKSDTSDVTLVQPSDWNNYHTFDVGKLSFIKDEFVGGVITAGNIGELGWDLAASTVIGTINGRANRPGIDSIQTSTGASASFLGLRYTVNVSGVIHPYSFFDCIFKVALSQTNDTTVARVGFSSGFSVASNGAQLTDGIWFEKDSNETSWFGELRASSTSTRTAALVAQSTNFVSFRVRRKDYEIDSIAFSVNGGTEVSLPVTTNMPIVNLQPFIQISNNNKVKTRAILVDYFQMLIVNMSR